MSVCITYAVLKRTIDTLYRLYLQFFSLELISIAVGKCSIIGYPKSFLLNSSFKSFSVSF